MEIYVGNLPPNIQMQELNNIFYNFGTILFIDIKNRCQPKFAFILFENPGSALNAVYATQNFVYNGYKLQVKLLTPDTTESDKSIPENNYEKFLQKESNKNQKKIIPRTFTTVNVTSTVVQPLVNNVPLTPNVPSTIPPLLPAGKIDLEKESKLTPTVQKKKNKNKIDLFKAFQLKKHPPKLPPSQTPGGLDDPYRNGLTKPGRKWYQRYLRQGFEEKEARIKADVHRYLARGMNEQVARKMAEDQFAKIFF